MTKLEILTLNDNKLDKKVKIQGTQYDRKRKYSDAQIKEMLKMSKKKSPEQIAEKLEMRLRDVLYHIDPEYRKAYIANLSGRHTGKDRITKSNRVTYKRNLVAAGKVTA